MFYGIFKVIIIRSIIYLIYIDLDMAQPLKKYSRIFHLKLRLYAVKAYNLINY